MKNKGLELYLIEAEKHKSQYFSELNELRQDLLNDNFRRRDYRATERVLQIFTELCVGLSKHWLKTLQVDSASDAYKTFSLLKENNQISSDELIRWRKIIGMRNGLVHDYLNIDPMIIEDVIRNKHYQELEVFSDKAIVVLQKTYK
ncbi:MAG: hypothetical protein ACJAS9_000435 [Polaribacter sp.]|jgi:uncharacterized protein YutE (UPF0331/DUF86 family)